MNRRGISLVLAGRRLFPNLTVLENLGLGVHLGDFRVRLSPRTDCLRR
jgi:ABC-type branched-subunit amino acid transport system ATPase component